MAQIDFRRSRLAEFSFHGTLMWNRPCAASQTFLRGPPGLVQFLKIEQILGPACGSLILDKRSLAQEWDCERAEWKHRVVVPCFLKFDSRQFRQQIDPTCSDADLEGHSGAGKIRFAYIG